MSAALVVFGVLLWLGLIIGILFFFKGAKQEDENEDENYGD